MDFIAENGMILTDKDFDEIAKEYESGDWEGGLGPITVGRPRLSEEGVRTISFKLPLSRLSAIDKAIEKSGQSRSEFIREAVDYALIAQLG